MVNEKDSQVVTLMAQDQDPRLARDIANTTAEVFKGEIAKL